MMRRAVPSIADLRHTKLCYRQDHYCGHPRQLPFRNYGNGEIVVGHHHAPARYATHDDVSHSYATGYFTRAKILLQRTLDHGESWHTEDEVVIGDYSRPLAERRAIMARADEPGVVRETRQVCTTLPSTGLCRPGGQKTIALTVPDAMVSFARQITGPEDERGQPALECFAFRSGDRGRTWETVPTRVSPPPGYSYVAIDGAAPIRFADDTLVVPAWVDDRNTGGPHSFDAAFVALYGSDDQGLSWRYLAEVVSEPTGRGRPGYANLLLLPSGRLQCYFNRIGGLRHSIEMTASDDGGYSWSTPRPLVVWGQSPWAALSRRHAWSGAGREGLLYRSPWPLRLRDGRIVVIFGRRHPPFGIGLIVSEDDGATWSAEGVIRADASDWDLGYPVATQLDDGRIFTAYYFMEHDGNGFGGTRHIAASFFRLL